MVNEIQTGTNGSQSVYIFCILHCFCFFTNEVMGYTVRVVVVGSIVRMDLGICPTIHQHDAGLDIPGGINIYKQ